MSGVHRSERWAGLHADVLDADRWIPGGMLVIEGSSQVDNSGGGA